MNKQSDPKELQQLQIKFLEGLASTAASMWKDGSRLSATNKLYLMGIENALAMYASAVRKNAETAPYVARMVESLGRIDARDPGLQDYAGFFADLNDLANFEKFAGPLQTQKRVDEQKIIDAIAAAILEPEAGTAVADAPAAIETAAETIAETATVEPAAKQDSTRAAFMAGQNAFSTVYRAREAILAAADGAAAILVKAKADPALMNTLVPQAGIYADIDPVAPSEARTLDKFFDDTADLRDTLLSVQKLAKDFVKSNPGYAGHAAAIDKGLAAYETVIAEQDDLDRRHNQIKLLTQSLEKIRNDWVVELEATQQDKNAENLKSYDIPAMLDALPLEYAHFPRLNAAMDVVSLLAADERQNAARHALIAFMTQNPEGNLDIPAGYNEALLDAKNKGQMAQMIAAAGDRMTLTALLAVGQHAQALELQRDRGAAIAYEVSQPDTVPDTAVEADKPVAGETASVDTPAEETLVEETPIEDAAPESTRADTAAPLSTDETANKLLADAKALYKTTQGALLALTFLQERGIVAFSKDDIDAAGEALKKLPGAVTPAKADPDLADAAAFEAYRMDMDSGLRDAIVPLDRLSALAIRAGHPAYLRAKSDAETFSGDQQMADEYSRINYALGALQQYRKHTAATFQSRTAFFVALAQNSPAYADAISTVNADALDKLLAKRDYSLSAEDRQERLNRINDRIAASPLALQTAYGITAGLAAGNKGVWKSRRERENYNLVFNLVDSTNNIVYRENALAHDDAVEGKKKLSAKKRAKIARELREYNRGFTTSLNEVSVFGEATVFPASPKLPLTDSVDQMLQKLEQEFEHLSGQKPQAVETPQQTAEGQTAEGQTAEEAPLAIEPRQEPRTGLIASVFGQLHRTLVERRASRKAVKALYAAATAEKAEQAAKAEAEAQAHDAETRAVMRTDLAAMVSGMYGKLADGKYLKNDYSEKLDASLSTLSDERVAYWHDNVSRHLDAEPKTQDQLLNNIANHPELDFGIPAFLLQKRPELASGYTRPFNFKKLLESARPAPAARAEAAMADVEPLTKGNPPAFLRRDPVFTEQPAAAKASWAEAADELKIERPLLPPEPRKGEKIKAVAGFLANKVGKLSATSKTFTANVVKSVRDKYPALIVAGGAGLGLKVGATVAVKTLASLAGIGFVATAVAGTAVMAGVGMTVGSVSAAMLGHYTNARTDGYSRSRSLYDALKRTGWGISDFKSDDSHWRQTYRALAKSRGMLANAYASARTERAEAGLTSRLGLLKDTFAKFNEIDADAARLVIGTVTGGLFTGLGFIGGTAQAAGLFDSASDTPAFVPADTGVQPRLAVPNETVIVKTENPAVADVAGPGIAIGTNPYLLPDLNDPLAPYRFGLPGVSYTLPGVDAVPAFNYQDWMRLRLGFDIPQTGTQWPPFPMYPGFDFDTAIPRIGADLPAAETGPRVTADAVTAPVGDDVQRAIAEATTNTGKIMAFTQDPVFAKAQAYIEGLNLNAADRALFNDLLTRASERGSFTALNNLIDNISEGGVVGRSFRDIGGMPINRELAAELRTAIAARLTETDFTQAGFKQALAINQQRLDVMEGRAVFPRVAAVAVETSARSVPAAAADVVTGMPIDIRPEIARLPVSHAGLSGGATPGSLIPAVITDNPVADANRGIAAIFDRITGRTNVADIATPAGNTVGGRFATAFGDRIVNAGGFDRQQLNTLLAQANNGHATAISSLKAWAHAFGQESGLSTQQRAVLAEVQRLRPAAQPVLRS